MMPRMRETQSQKIKTRRGRQAKPQNQIKVLVWAKVDPEVAAIIQQIADERRWTISGTVRYACELLVEGELPKAA